MYGIRTVDFKQVGLFLAMPCKACTSDGSDAEWQQLIGAATYE